MNLILTVLLVKLSLAAVSADKLQCLKCDKVPALDQCSGHVECDDSEECFLEEVTDSSLNLVVNGGCRSRTVCRIMESLSKNPLGKRSGLDSDQVNCAQCCQTSPDNLGPCNNRLCGRTPPKPEIKCLSCDRAVSSVRACTNYETCEDTQVCSSSIEVFDHLIKFRLGCLDRHVCKAFLANNIRKRAGLEGLDICDACCYGHLCNMEDCFIMKKNMTLSGLGIDPTTPGPTVKTTSIITNPPTTKHTTLSATTAPTPAPTTAPTTPKPAPTTAPTTPKHALTTAPTTPIISTTPQLISGVSVVRK